ncbi:MAG: lipocalin-like domain-containing protein [Terriglobia bacterium]
MKPIRIGILIALAALSGLSQTHSRSDQEKFIGAWHLVSIVGPDGKQIKSGVPIGMLIYTRDGHMSVQLMYPESQKSLSNEYVENGYEASFGSYDINAAAHTLTHHVQGSNTRDRLVGKDLPRRYQFNRQGELVIKSARPDEHWSVTWKHY